MQSGQLEVWTRARGPALEETVVDVPLQFRAISAIHCHTMDVQLEDDGRAEVLVNKSKCNGDSASYSSYSGSRWGVLGSHKKVYGAYIDFENREGLLMINEHGKLEMAIDDELWYVSPRASTPSDPNIVQVEVLIDFAPRKLSVRCAEDPREAVIPVCGAVWPWSGGQGKDTSHAGHKDERNMHLIIF